MLGLSASGLIDKFAKRLSGMETSFTLQMPDGSERLMGNGEPKFEIVLNNQRAVRALGSLDEANIGESYLKGDFDINGDLLEMFALRGSMDDRHPMVTAWRFIQPLLFGQVHTNRQAISSHYDADPRMFLSFLDKKVPAYTQGVYESDDDTLSAAMERKFDYTVEMCELGPRKRVLEIGPGWGAFARHALRKGVEFTGVTNSSTSQTYLNEFLGEFADHFRINFVDILAYEPKEKYDAIVIMGVIEHIPNYLALLKKFESVLKPGGLVFVDASAARTKYELSTFMVRHIYPGNHSFFVLHDFMEKLNKTPFEILEVQNDRHSYFLTFKQWAINLEASKDFICENFGEVEYRKFRLYLWGATYEFMVKNLDCYRLILYLPKNELDWKR